MSAPGTDDPVVRRAIEDPEFRERLVASPASAIEEATGVSVPDGVEIVVVENTSRRFHIVLPPNDISIEDIDASGGGVPWSNTQEMMDWVRPPWS